MFPAVQYSTPPVMDLSIQDLDVPAPSNFGGLLIPHHLKFPYQCAHVGFKDLIQAFSARSLMILEQA